MKIKITNKKYTGVNTLLALYGIGGALYSFKKSKIASAIFASTALVALSSTCIALDNDLKPAK